MIVMANGEGSVASSDRNHILSSKPVRHIRGR
jgi:hypothetical protein